MQKIDRINLSEVKKSQKIYLLIVRTYESNGSETSELFRMTGHEVIEKLKEVFVHDEWKEFRFCSDRPTDVNSFLMYCESRNDIVELYPFSIGSEY